ncbi:DUF2884 family protein [Chiayiivirga flava]|uniref:DUF2884 family protein n=1 Tax=Chiayiivirga flava TaxID=659595 RepID=A0A7W8DAM2_9GAMM|nr:DUF2884 family protein [Chiayiivirga flava]MBB5209208.1 hypothetical protein [Chiayiivirga flava]
MKHTLLSCAVAIAALCAGSANARGFTGCDVDSDYDLRIGEDALTFTRETGSPQRVVMRAGTLAVDGVAQDLTAADAARISTYERDIRAMVPEVKAIAVQAVGIAIDAVVQVATAFAGNNADATRLARIDALGDALVERIDASVDTADWRDAQFDAAIAEVTAELVPMIVGDIAAVAVTAALSGDEDTLAQVEARAASLEREVETRVEKRAGDIERRADRLCPRVQALDEIESALELRLADGSRLDLVRLEDE